MNINFNNRPKDCIPEPFVNNPYFSSRIGFWGNIAAVNSKMNSCDVTADVGITWRNIPVASSTWVNGNGSGERNLPMEGSRVFVLTPSGTLDGAFILCSGYALGETSTHSLYCKNDQDKDYYNNSVEKISQGGWIYKENNEIGNISLESKDGNFKLEINLNNDSKYNQEKQLKLFAWENEIVITEKGMTITPKNKVTLDAKEGIEINGNNKAVEIKNANTFKVNGNLEVSV